MDNTVVLEVDPRSVLAAIKQANSAVDSWEGKTVGAGDKMQKSLERMADMLLKVHDKQRNSLERLTQSIEKQAAAYSKTGVEKMIAERDRIIKKLGDEQGMVDRVTASYAKMIAEYEKANKGGGGISSIAGNAQGMITAPLDTVKGLISGAGPAGMAIAGIAAALGAAEAAGLAATRSLADYGVEIRDVQLRTGLAAKEVGQFSFAAKAVGQDVSIFERTMRGLTTAVEDQTEAGEKARKALQKLGVAPRDAAGEIRPTAELLQDISKGLNEIPNAIERNKAGMDIFKKAWVEMAPAMLELNKNVERAKELGLGPSENDVARWLKYKEQLTEADAIWSRMERKLKEGLAGTIWIDIKTTGAKILLDFLGGNSGQPVHTAIEGSHSTTHKQNVDYLLGAVTDMSHAQSERGQVDDMIRSLGGGKDLNGQLRDAESALSKLTKPEIGVTSREDVQTYRDAEAKVDHLKKMVEGTKQLREEEQKLRSFEKSMNERDLTPIEKIWQQRDDLGFKPGSANYNAATGAALRGVGKELDKEQDGVNKQLRETFSKAADDYRKDILRNASEQEKLLDEHAKHVVKEFEDHVKAVQAAARTADRYTMDTNAVNLQHAGRMAQISGGGDEMSNLAQELSTRKAIRDQEMQIKDAHSWLYDMDAERRKDELENLKDRYEWEEKIAEYRNKQDEQHEQQIRGAVEPLVHTLLTKPGQFGKQLGATVKDAALKPVEGMMTDAITSVLKPVLFGGGKQDPLKVSTDLNTQMTAANTAAILNLNATLATGPVMRSGGRSYRGGTDGSAAMPWGGASIGFGGGAAPSWSGSSSDGSSFPMNMGGDGLPMSDIRTIAPDLTGWTGSSKAATAGGGVAGGILGMIKGLGGNKAQSWTGMLKSIKGTNWGGITRAHTDDDIDGENTGRITGVSGVAGQAMSAGGMMLAQNGLLGSNRGTGLGIAEGAIGGAAVGFQQGGFLGAAIGGSIGLLTGIGEKLAGVETPTNEAKRLVKQQYGISIDTNMANQIVSLAQQKYAGHVSIAVRDPDVRKMLMLYAQGTGQKFPMSASTPQSGSLAETGGKLYQQATYQDGTPYTFQSNLPVMGGVSGGNYPSPGGPNTSAGMGPMALYIGGADAANFMTGNYVTPQFVADQSLAAQNSSYGRTQQSANMQLPGLTIA